MIHTTITINLVNAKYKLSHLSRNLKKDIASTHHFWSLTNHLSPYSGRCIRWRTHPRQLLDLLHDRDKCLPGSLRPQGVLPNYSRRSLRASNKYWWLYRLLAGAQRCLGRFPVAQPGKDIPQNISKIHPGLHRCLQRTAHTSVPLQSLHTKPARQVLHAHCESFGRERARITLVGEEGRGRCWIELVRDWASLTGSD